ncbi:MAG: hypothetical protein ACYTXA_12670 [Nostoc sp.]
MRLRLFTFLYYGYAKLFFSVAASLVVLFKLMLKHLTITATLNQRILLKTATLNYFLVLWLRRTIILCGSFAESENFHIASYAVFIDSMVATPNQNLSPA